jgi:SnoaL-like domain
MRARAEDWSELVELLHRFTWTVDVGARHLLDGRLSETVTFDAHTVTGRPAATCSREEFLASLAGNSAAFDGLQHLVGNHLVDIGPDGRRGVVRAYGHVSLAIDDAERPVKRNAVRYRLEASRDDGQDVVWLIDAITVDRVWDEPNAFVAGCLATRRAAQDHGPSSG